MKLAEQTYLHKVSTELVCCSCRNRPPGPFLGQQNTYKAIMSSHCNKKKRIKRANHRIAGRQEKWKKSEDENLKRHFHKQYYHRCLFRSISNRVLYLFFSPQSQVRYSTSVVFDFCTLNRYCKDFANPYYTYEHLHRTFPGGSGTFVAHPWVCVYSMVIWS